MVKEVTNIHKKEPVQAVIDLCEELLQEAKEGNLRALIHIDRDVSGIINSGWRGDLDDGMVLRLDVLKQIYIQSAYIVDDVEFSDDE